MTSASAHILVIRFSSLGDVALTVPVIRNLLRQNPNIQVSVLSKDFNQALFSDLDRVQFIAFDSNKYKGVFGIWKFAKQFLFPQNFSHVVDLHDVLRSKVLCFFYGFRSAKISIFSKGRDEKIDAISSKSIQTTALEHVAERYANAFRVAGFACDLSDRNQVTEISVKQNYTIGIAPLSKHFTKNYPLDQVLLLLQEIMKNPQWSVKILCASSEKSLLQHLCIHDRIQFLTTGQSFAEELKNMQQLDLMISMDSANMHLANMYHIPTLTIWGGTHPNIGFSAYYKRHAIDIQTELSCRPCSVYGRADCPLGHFRCMQEIQIDSIMQSISKILS